MTPTAITAASATRCRPGSAASSSGRYGSSSASAGMTYEPIRSIDGTSATYRAGKPPPRSSMPISMSSARSRSINRPVSPIAWRQATGLPHCEPTWKVIPYGRRPSRRASSIRPNASSASAPNLRDSGKTLALSSTRSRTYTAAPGACSAILASSLGESKLNRHSPARCASAMCAGGLTGLLYSTPAGSTPSRCSSRSSPREAISKLEPLAASVVMISGDGLPFIA